MTAIFAVWNNIGFSLASDSNQSVTQDNQTWIDPVEKILMLQNHQVAIAGAGASLHQGVEVNEVFRSWEETIPDSGFSTLDEYLQDFIHWYSFQKFPGYIESIDKMREESNYWMEDIFEGLNGVIGSIEEISEYVDSVNISRSYLNVYGSEWSRLASISEVTEGILSDCYLSIQSIYNGYNEKYKESSYNLDQHEMFQFEISKTLVDSFEEKFGIEFDEADDAHQQIVSYCIFMIENALFVECPAKFMIVGYGKADWLPTGIIFELSNTLFGVPRIKISHHSDPNRNWYLALATESAVHQLTSGHSRERGQEIIDIAKSHLKTGHHEDFEKELNQLMNKKFHSSLARIDNLTLGRLEFVSRLFVQIEALKSFLDEPVPGVGGDTQVISMTKTTRRQKNYRELD